ncbi:MAG TPA: elongation factor G-like protein EF-G2 [Nocardioides bacterium]|uniref:elongation factor G-like protein EF-G2 n=1 Tax=uncultured Nocardioides sp. TaxID=198441 RepID=UPI000ECF044D|nr:elongation factor G-like protein EF-G2 [uncultured Nocardioides sp.]HCB07656.1 elongation factor G-like protein EF-G2 [Nocardioides sp.]
MADKGARAAGRQDLEALKPDEIRNVVLVGPSSGGKTTLLETLLVRTGALNRAGTVADGTTVSDAEPGERAHGRSMSLSVAPVVHRGVKINLIDTPGYADFVGELRAGLRAADCALFVTAANEPVDTVTAMLWRECADVGMPRAVVVTKLDHARADYAGVLAAAQATFGSTGDKVLPLYVPVMSGNEVTSLIGLLGSNSSAEHDEARAALIEGIIEESEDEGLMDRYLEGEPVTEDALLEDLHRAMARGTFFPVVAACSTSGVGCEELLDLMVRGFPAPSEHPSPATYTPAGAAAQPVECDPFGPLVAEVVKTTSDPYVGRISLVRVFSGTLEPDRAVHVSGHLTSFFGAASGHADHDDDERVGALSYPFGAALQPAQRVVCGDIATVGRLTRAETGDTLSAVEDPRVLRPWSLPTPLLPVAIEAATKSDEDKLSTALSRLAAEDPSLRVEMAAGDSGQLVLWTMGEAHADAALERLAERFGVSVHQVDVQVAMRETLRAPGKALGRHVKQSGGHGQYAVCEIEVEPLPRGSGFEFAEKVVGGVVPRQFIPSVEKGIRAQMERGCGGHQMVDIKVTLVGGKAHSVDSSDMAFQSAGALALREAADAAGVVLLEPYDEVEVSVPDELVGTVMSDLAARRGRVLGQDTADGRAVVRAHVPASELIRYAIDLRSATHGTGSFTRAFAAYEPVS